MVRVSARVMVRVRFRVSVRVRIKARARARAWVMTGPAKSREGLWEGSPCTASPPSLAPPKPLLHPAGPHRFPWEPP